MAEKRVWRIAVIPGDGIGKDVIGAGLRVMQAAQEIHGGVRLEYETFPWSCGYYLEHGRMMPEDGIKTLAGFDAIYLGAVGFPKLVPDHVSLWGLLLPIRKEFDLYVNLRPCRLLPGLHGILRGKTSDDINFVILRENTEGAYSGVGGRVHVGSEHEVAIQSIVFTRNAVERIMRQGFQLARRDGRKKVTSVTKSNSMQHSQVFWDEVFAHVSGDFPEIVAEQVHVDAMAARMVRNPESLDVVVASNLFGDILTDIGAALQGGLGMAASGNIHPGRVSLFEPVHGSAPPLAGRNEANPAGAILSAALMLEYLGHTAASVAIERAVRDAVAHGETTRDLGGTLSTVGAGAAIRRRLAS